MLNSVFAFDDNGTLIPVYEFDPAVLPDDREIEIQQRVDELVKLREREISGESLMRFAALLISDKKPKLLCYSLLFAFGAADGKTQPQIAKECGVTKQAVANRVTQLHEWFKSKQARTMRSDETREKFRTQQKEKSNERATQSTRENRNFYFRLSSPDK